eukprot:gnl/MRDRNA2_/MRDRNA2_120354_c0_seq1.p1 gnl/MRDRNA2_/MRDRNA2_120354_c0~~gnl/MRDRNA2_/MRDRNA2_120354_c0_seq1.p1  ORF type:complete len:390 (-),score=96.92 gnl/MRDRNA2_/MRDRNA2_120354_c0_seq1:83-1252(-)
MVRGSDSGRGRGRGGSSSGSGRGRGGGASEGHSKPKPNPGHTKPYYSTRIMGRGRGGKGLSRHYPTIEKPKSKPAESETGSKSSPEKEQRKAEVRKVIADVLRKKGGECKLEEIATTEAVCEARGKAIRKLGKFLKAFPEFELYSSAADPGKTPDFMIKLAIDASKSNNGEKKKTQKRQREKPPAEDAEGELPNASIKHVVLDPKSQKDAPKIVVREAVIELLQKEGGKASLCFVAGDKKVKESRKGAAKNLTYFLQSQSDVFKVYSSKFVGQKGNEGSKVMVKLVGALGGAAENQKNEEEQPFVKKKKLNHRSKGKKAQGKEVDATDDEETAPVVKKRKKSKLDAEEPEDEQAPAAKQKRKKTRITEEQDEAKAPAAKSEAINALFKV